MSAASRNKGQRGERELARRLTAEGFPATRGVQYHGGADSPDVRCTSLPGIHWEVKRTERLRLYEALAQARHDAGGKLPVVAHRANNAPWVAILSFTDLLAVLRESDCCKGGRNGTE
jgi:Holliday junction resolvase